MDSVKNAFGNITNYFSRMKNMTAVETKGKAKDLVGTRELISNLKMQVVAEERWELPSETQDDGASVQTTERQGIVVALEDGQTRYLVRRIPNEQEEGVVDVIVTYASHMDPNWVRVEEKQVQNTKLEDYLDQGDGDSGNEDKKEATDVNRVKGKDKGDSTEGHLSQFEDKRDSSDSHKNSEDTARKM